MASASISLILSGTATSVALYAAQLVRASPVLVTLLGTASQKYRSFLKNHPYDYSIVVDYRAHDWPEQVLTLTNAHGLDIGFDCVSEDSDTSQYS